MKDLPKLGLVLAVVATGVVAALPFQRPQQPNDTTVKTSPEGLVLRRNVNLQIRAGNVASAPRNRSRSPRRATEPAVIRSQPHHENPRLPPRPPAPALSDRFRRLDQETDLADADAVQSSIRSATNPHPYRRAKALPEPIPTAETAMVLHRIVDGDSLPELARRYLGDSELYLELYEFNRDVLVAPEILPIGREIKIPFRSKTRSN